MFQNSVGRRLHEGQGRNRTDMLRRKTSIIGVATALVALGVGLPVALAGSAGISVVDYAQCANGTASATTCAGGWINGVLQASNSHFKESEVTPQRLEVSASAAATHTVTLTYQTRKGGYTDGTHAYDGLTTWNKTVTGANRCANLSRAAQTGIGCTAGVEDPATQNPAATAAFPTDNTSVPPSTGSTTTIDNNVTSRHVPTGQVKLYGAVSSATFVNNAGTSELVTHSAATGAGDDYATVTLQFTTTSAGGNVQVLFGGHLAVSPLVAKGGQYGWGPGLGASNINGGPYHIKWAAADGASVGSRDNQIMGSSIGALAQPTISSVSSPSFTLSASTPTPITVSDTATVTITASDGAAPTGTVTFTLYGPITLSSGHPSVAAGDCVDPTTFDADGHALDGNVVGTGSGSVSGTTAPYRARSGSVTLASPLPGTYAWIASYGGDLNNQAVAGHCGDAGESFTISPANPTATKAQRVGAKVTVTGYGTLQEGVDFDLYSDAACTDDATHTPVFHEPGVAIDADGVAETVGTFYGTAGSTYYWKIHYPGDDYNAAADLVACGGMTFTAN